MSSVTSAPGKVLLDADAIERNPDLDRVALVGIHTRGVPLAHRLRRLVADRADVDVAVGAVDITFCGASSTRTSGRRSSAPSGRSASVPARPFNPVQRGRKGAE